MSIKNIVGSTESALTAMRQFDLALKQSGFEEGTTAYTQMADILVGQWMWTRENGYEQFDDRFAEIGRLAAGVYEVLSPYVASMRKLAVLQDGSAAEAVLPDSVPETIAARILDHLGQSTTPLSVNALRSGIGESSRKTKAVVNDLAAAGQIIEHRRGHRIVYAIAEQA